MDEKHEALLAALEKIGDEWVNGRSDTKAKDMFLIASKAYKDVTGNSLYETVKDTK